MEKNCDELVKQLQERLPAQSNEYLKSPRYFRSCLHDHNYVLDKAEAAILATYKWREDIGIDSILEENFDDIFVPFDYEFGGHDLEGRPILTIHAKDMGKKTSAKMHQAVKDGLKDKDRTIRWAFFMGETILKAMADANSKSSTHTVDSITVLVDMSGVKVLDFIQYVPLVMPTIQPLVNTCREHYSGIVNKMYVINGSKTPAKLAVQLMKNGTNSQIEERVRILGKKKHKWQKVLLENIDPNQLTSRFGGTKGISVRSSLSGPSSNEKSK